MNIVQGPLEQYGLSDLFSIDGSERARRGRLAPTQYVAPPVQRVAANDPLPDIGIASMPLPVPVATAIPYPGDVAVGVPATVVEQTVTATTQDMSKRPIVSPGDYHALKRFIYYNADKASATDFWDVAAYERAHPFDRGTPLSFKPFR